MVNKRSEEARKNPDYVNNAEFSAAVAEYVLAREKAKQEGKPVPQVPNYVAECFLKISSGLSRKANFVRYTYREEMMMDGVENCLKAIENYNIDARTRTSKPNAFGYFTQIIWYAFLRRIEKEKRQQDIKMKYMTQQGIEMLIQEEIESNPSSKATHAFVEDLRERIDLVKEKDKEVKDFGKQEKKRRKKRAVVVDSDLTDFME